MRRIGLLAIVLVIVGACTLDKDGGTPTPSPSPLPSGVAQLQPSTEEELAPGRYSVRAFAPRVTFEVEESWYSVQLVNGFFDIQQDVESPDVIAVQFARPTHIHGPDGPVEPEDAANAVELLSGNPELAVVETSDSLIDGLEGSQVTFENAGDEVANFMALPPGRIAINPERRIWAAFFDTDAGLLAIMVGGSVDGWDEALAAAEPVLESITIGGGEEASGRLDAPRLRPS